MPATVIAQTQPAAFPWPALAGGAFLGVAITLAFLTVRRVFRQAHQPQATGIEKAEGVCGGAARIRQTRIPVWQLVEARDMGISDAKLLADYPDLSAQDLVNAWAYARSHPKEIEGEIRQNNEIFEDEVA
jgi:uncharacterized protein (DUF433 family)